MDGKRINKLAEHTPPETLQDKIAGLEAQNRSRGVAKSIRTYKAALAKALAAQTQRAPEMDYSTDAFMHRSVDRPRHDEDLDGLDEFSGTMGRAAIRRGGLMFMTI